MKYWVLQAFPDVGGITRHVGEAVELTPHRADILRRQGIIGGPADPAPLPPPPVLVGGDPAHTTSREENIAGLASAMLLANTMKATINAHYADAADHTAAIDNVNTLVAPDAYDIPSLIALVSEMITSYVAHDDDAELLANWVYHAGAETADHSLASVVAPINLQTSITRLIDIKAKYNAHDADGTAHGVGGSHEELIADPAYGASIRIEVPQALPGDGALFTILDSGTGTVTGVGVDVGLGFVDFQFSADPQNDAIISYLVVR